jgi:hypothetical protein
MVMKRPVARHQIGKENPGGGGGGGCGGRRELTGRMREAGQVQTRLKSRVQVGQEGAGSQVGRSSRGGQRGHRGEGQLEGQVTAAAAG